MKAFVVNGEPHYEDPVDFPCSYSFRAYYRETMYGEYLQPLEPRQKPQQEVRYVYLHVDNSRRITSKLNALDNAVKYLLKKEEHKGVKKGRYLG